MFYSNEIHFIPNRYVLSQLNMLVYQLNMLLCQLNMLVCQFNMLFCQLNIYFLQTATCNSNEFQCESDRSCISFVGRCNGRRECSDGSDEAGCRKFIII